MGDLAVTVDASYVRGDDGEIVGRQGGIKGWMEKNAPDLMRHYKTLMHYKAVADKFRLYCGIQEPDGAEEALGLTIPEHAATALPKQERHPKAAELLATCRTMTALDAGAEDFSEEEDSYEIITSPEDFENVKNEALSLLKYVHDMELYEIVAAVKKISEYKLEISDYFDIMSIWYRDVLLFKATKDANRLVFREELGALRKCAQRSSYEGIEQIVQALDTAKRRLDANVNFDLVMELLFLTIQENG